MTYYVNKTNPSSEEFNGTPNCKKFFIEDVISPSCLRPSMTNILKTYLQERRPIIYYAIIPSFSDRLKILLLENW